jgi:glycosyltransferase involved in cell wall biosynthesis
MLKFSVIIPHYNDEAGLARCLQALHEQDYPAEEFEILVVDDCSPGFSLETLRDRYPQVRFFQLSSNRGPGAARNYGIDHAAGKFLAFVDSDAMVCEQWLRSYQAELEQGAEVACGPVLHRDSYLARLTAITSFGEFQDREDGYRKVCPSVNYAIRAETMRNFRYEENMGFAGEDSLLTSQMVKAGLTIRYLANAWVLHDPSLDLRSFNRRAYLYGVGFRASRSRESALSGHWLHKYLRGLSALPLFFIRVTLDVSRLLRHRRLLNLKAGDLISMTAGIVWVRLIYAIGVAAGYLIGDT